MQEMPIDNLIYYQFRKNNYEKDNPYFWGNVTKDKVQNLAQNILDSSFLNRRKSTLLDNVKGFLGRKCNDCLQREKIFLEAVSKSSQEQSKIESISFPTIEETKTAWVDYVRNFHKCILTLLKLDEDIKDLLEQFRNGRWISSISGKVSSMSSTILKGDNTYEDFFDDLMSLFFKKISVNKQTQNSKDSQKYNPLVASKDSFQTFINKYNFPDKVKAAITSQLEKIKPETFSDAITQAIDSQFKEEQKFLKKSSSSREKGITDTLEKLLKKIFLQSMRNIFQSNNIIYELSNSDNENPYNVAFKLYPAFSEQTGTYSANVSIELSKLQKQENKQAKNEAFKIFWNFIGEHLKSGSPAQILWTGKKQDIQDKHSRLLKVVRTAVFKNFDKQRSNKDATTILSAYGEAQLKGLLGELATAIQFAFLKDTQTTITGSETTNAGQLSFDVAIKIAKNSFGVQVKNFNKVAFSKFYSTTFSASKENEMVKYFHEEGKDKYWFLFANGEMLKETKIIKGDLRQKTIESFYNYVDNFLRISAGDLDQAFELNRSDIFIVGDMIIPSSYFFSLIYQKINEKTPTEFFKLEGDFLSPPDLSKNNEPIKINNNLFKNLTISFTGISSGVKLKI